AKELRELKLLMKTRERLSKALVQLKNGVKGMRIAAQTINIEALIKKNDLLIKKIETQIKAIDKKMLELIKSSPKLYETYKQITSVIGVGPVTATKTIIESGNFKKITKGRKFCCHAGLAPFEYKSGSSVKEKTKTSPLCNKS